MLGCRPNKKADIFTLNKKIANFYKSYFQNENVEQWTNNITNIDNFQLNINYSISSTSSINSFFRNSSSKIYYFKELPELRNATKSKKILFIKIN
jgi:uncharacterized membrane protein YgaE (UPF0421/DUF939 family)